MIHTVSERVLVKHSFITAITAAANNGTAVDTRGFTRALAIFDSSPSGAGTTSDCKLQEGDLADGSDAADVTGAAFTQVTTAGGQKIATMDIKLEARKRYLRLVHTGAGAAAAGTAAGVFALVNAELKPVSQDVAAKSV